MRGNEKLFQKLFSGNENAPDSFNKRNALQFQTKFRAAIRCGELRQDMVHISAGG